MCASGDPHAHGKVMACCCDARLDVRSEDGRVDCEDLRAGCAALTYQDGFVGSYDCLTVATTPDGRATHPVPVGRGLS